MLQSEIILTCFWMTVLLCFNLSATQVMAAVIFLNFPKELGTNGESIRQKGVQRFLLDTQGNYQKKNLCRKIQEKDTG